MLSSNVRNATNRKETAMSDLNRTEKAKFGTTGYRTNDDDGSILVWAFRKRDQEVVLGNPDNYEKADQVVENFLYRDWKFSVSYMQENCDNFLLIEGV